MEEKAGLSGRREGRLLLLPAQHSPASGLADLDPPAGMRQSPKGRLAQERLLENRSQGLPAVPLRAEQWLFGVFQN